MKKILVNTRLPPIVGLAGCGEGAPRHPPS